MSSWDASMALLAGVAIGLVLARAKPRLRALIDSAARRVHDEPSAPSRAAAEPREASGVGPGATVATGPSRVERRKSERYRCRLPCEVRLGPALDQGTILDVSVAGFSIQTELSPDEGETLEVLIQAPGCGSPELRAVVWHKRRVRHRGKEKQSNVLGMMLEEGDDRFAKLVARLASEKSRSSSSRPPKERTHSKPSHEGAMPEAMHWFNVRVKQRSTPRSRAFSIGALSETDARERAIAEIGQEWEILELRPA